MARESETERMASGLKKPFPPTDLVFTPVDKAKVKEADRLYVTVKPDPIRVIERLNDVLGFEGWSEAHTLLPSTEVECRLTIRDGDNWVARTGVSSPAASLSEQGTSYRPGYLESTCAAATKFGVGFYLLKLRLLVDWDKEKGNIKTPPQLPAFALPEEWLPADRQAADAAGKLIQQIATEGKLQPAEVQLKLLKRHSPLYSATTDLATLPRVHIRAVQTDAVEWLKGLAKKPDGTKQPQTAA